MARELIFSFTKKDFEVTWYNGSGAGGQNRNKNQNCCRIKHIESGLISSCEEHKSARQNKKKAFRKLVEKLVPIYAPKAEKTRNSDALKKHTRTYNECTDRVKDHVTGDTFSYRQTVGKGDTTVLIESRRSHEIRKNG